MRGYFGLGVEGISKPRNVGSLFRSAHAFGGSFVFAVAPVVDIREVYKADTSEAAKHMPLYEYADADEMNFPKGCQLVGVELCDDAVWMPSFKHPLQAAYILGPERGSLSPAVQEKCDHLVKIPTKFCVNVGIAGAIMLYDRALSMGRWADRPIRPGGPTEEMQPHVSGGPVIRSRKDYED